MDLKQISVFLENKRGRLAEVCRVLSGEKINIRALSLADTADFGVLRIIVNDPERCIGVLKKNNFVAQVTPVIAAEVEDKPGGLYRVLAVLEKSGINVEYMYATVEKSIDNAVVIFKVDEPVKAINALRENGITPVTSETLKNL